MFLEISRNLQENTCARLSFLIKLEALLKKRLWHRRSPVNFVKFLRTGFLTEHLWWLLLKNQTHFTGRMKNIFKNYRISINLRFVEFALNFVEKNFFFKFSFLLEIMNRSYIGMIINPNKAGRFEGSLFWGRGAI